MCALGMYSYFQKHSDEEIINGVEPLPGVIETLTSISKLYKNSGSVLCALVTGNVEGIARRKMKVKSNQLLNIPCFATLNHTNLTTKACGLYDTGFLSQAAADQQEWEGMEACSFLGGFGSDFCSGDIEDMSRIYKDRGEQILICYRRAQSLLKGNERIVRVGIIKVAAQH